MSRVQPLTARDYYNAYHFAKPRVIGTAKDIYNYSQPKLLIAGKFAAKEAKAGGEFALKEARAGYDFVADKVSSIGKPKKIYPSDKVQLSFDTPKKIDTPKKVLPIAQPKPVQIPMVKKTTVDGIEVYESE